MSLGWVQGLGLRSVRFVATLGQLTAFLVLVFRATFSRPVRIRRFVDELYQVGVVSIPIVCVSAATIGMVLALQGYSTLARFGATSNLGAVVGLTLIKELGPVLTALLVTGRAGSAIAAEIGSMVATQQLDGLRLMSLDPIDLEVAPNAIAMLVSMPLLSALFIVVGLAGGFMYSSIALALDSGAFLSSLENAVVFRTDVAGSFVKSLVFGILVGLIATYRGYTAAPHATGVSAATTSTVVHASVAILIFDYFITALWEVRWL